MSQHATRGMHCPHCGPVLALRQTHPIRNSLSVLASIHTLGMSLAAIRIDRWRCSLCGTPTQPAGIAPPRPMQATVEAVPTPAALIEPLTQLREQRQHNADTLVANLERLAELHAAHRLTADEYTHAKATLLHAR